MLRETFCNHTIAEQYDDSDFANTNLANNKDAPVTTSADDSLEL